MRPGLAARLASASGSRSAAGRVRRRQPLDAGLVDFGSNDYLGLAGHPEIAHALCRAAGEFGAGARASALVTGYCGVHAELEARLAVFFGFEAAAVFPSGYQANLAVGQALLGRGEAMLADRLNHASLNDAARLAGARVRRYGHADPAAAEARLDPRCVLVATDGVFSMDGDTAPLRELAGLADRAGVGLWLDDAHGIGVLGETGRGLIEASGVGAGRVDVFTGTFGKALGTGGAFIAGDRALIEELENTARGLIYSTALSPALAGATIRALEILAAEPWRRERLAGYIERFRRQACALPVAPVESDTPIQPLVLGDDRRALAAAAGLETRGFRVAAIRPPTVPEGTARLRVSLSAAHTPGQIDALLEALDEVLTETVA